jgi:hypothetical protein
VHYKATSVMPERDGGPVGPDYLSGGGGGGGVGCGGGVFFGGGTSGAGPRPGRAPSPNRSSGVISDRPVARPAPVLPGEGLGAVA